MAHVIKDEACIAVSTNSLKRFERFAANLKQAGLRCDLHIYDGQGRGCFNSDPSLTITLIEADKFLPSLGYLSGEPTLPLPAAGVPSEDAPKQKKKVRKSE